ncbi:hypothetical protein [Brachybacterium paraconglomeratum]|uniref:hypothetical protein n=1 Tax=Brachybacterium paraconglomeratum TaxID=173362 RepID=UPI0022AFAAB2|nr:hypothetical protein [Brachybacterium paraconglomeratum]MCZ4326775.1 hypothetical protein [Brachybacterium paraconglomeratum]
MPSTSDKKHARAIMARHDGVKYTEALRFVAELKEMRERNESRAALGLDPVVTIDPKGPAWKPAEAHRFLAADGTCGLRIARSVAETHEPACYAPPEATDADQGPAGNESLLLDEWHHVTGVTGSGKTFLAWFDEVQRASRVASGRDQDAERLRQKTRMLLQSTEDFNLLTGSHTRAKRSGMGADQEDLVDELVTYPEGTTGLFLDEEANVVGGWLRVHDDVYGSKSVYTTFTTCDSLPTVLTDSDTEELNLGRGAAVELTPEGIVPIVEVDSDRSQFFEQVNMHDQQRVFLIGDTTSRCSDFVLLQYRDESCSWWGSSCGPDIVAEGVEGGEIQGRLPADAVSVVVSGTVPVAPW